MLTPVADDAIRQQRMREYLNSILWELETCRTYALSEQKQFIQAGMPLTIEKDQSILSIAAQHCSLAVVKMLLNEYSFDEPFSYSYSLPGECHSPVAAAIASSKTASDIVNILNVLHAKSIVVKFIWSDDSGYSSIFDFINQQDASSRYQFHLKYIELAKNVAKIIFGAEAPTQAAIMQKARQEKSSDIEQVIYDMRELEVCSGDPSATTAAISVSSGGGAAVHSSSGSNASAADRPSIHSGGGADVRPKGRLLPMERIHLPSRLNDEYNNRKKTLYALSLANKQHLDSGYVNKIKSLEISLNRSGLSAQQRALDLLILLNMNVVQPAQEGSAKPTFDSAALPFCLKPNFKKLQNIVFLDYFKVMRPLIEEANREYDRTVDPDFKMWQELFKVKACDQLKQVFKSLGFLARKNGPIKQSFQRFCQVAKAGTASKVSCSIPFEEVEKIFNKPRGVGVVKSGGNTKRRRVSLPAARCRLVTPVPQASRKTFAQQLSTIFSRTGPAMPYSWSDFFRLHYPGDKAGMVEAVLKARPAHDNPENKYYQLWNNVFAGLTAEDFRIYLTSQGQVSVKDKCDLCYKAGMPYKYLSALSKHPEVVQTFNERLQEDILQRARQVTPAAKAS